jgi:hypothetical protein
LILERLEMVSKVNENDIWKIIKFEINFIIMEKTSM